MSSAQGLREGRATTARRARCALPTHHLLPLKRSTARRTPSDCAQTMIEILECLCSASMRLSERVLPDPAGRRDQQACRVAAPRDTSLQSEAERFVEALENIDEESGTNASQTEVERLQEKLRECQAQVSSTSASPVTRWTAALQLLTCSPAPFTSTAFIMMALAWQVAHLQTDLDAAYRDCFLQTSRDLSDELATPSELQSISEASFGDLGRTNPEVLHYPLSF